MATFLHRWGFPVLWNMDLRAQLRKGRSRLLQNTSYEISERWAIWFWFHPREHAAQTGSCLCWCQRSLKIFSMFALSTEITFYDVSYYIYVIITSVVVVLCSMFEFCTVFSPWASKYQKLNPKQSNILIDRGSPCDLIKWFRMESINIQNKF